MAWEDCVVDIHSTKLPQHTLESIFSKCGAVRSVIYWKGQGEKLHVFMEYKTSSAAESARIIGLDRNDLQVIKLSNNDMLKRKFRELEKQTGNRSRPMSYYPERTIDARIGSVRDHKLPAKPVAVVVRSEELGAEEAHKSLNAESSSTRHGPSRRLSASLSTSFFQSSCGTGYLGPGHSEPTPPSPSPGSADLQCLLPPGKTDTSGSRSAPSPVRNSSFGGNRQNGAPSLPLKGSSSRTQTDAATGPNLTSAPKKFDASLTVLEIPHAGEIIRFDLDKQLEPSPAGIISMLSAVKADQKLWMMTAAYYNGKNNLEAAREVLEAGINMAIQAGMETDTKPFWHLLNQINCTLKAANSTCPFASLSSSPTSTSTLVNGGGCSRGSGENHSEGTVRSTNVSPHMKEKEEPGISLPAKGVFFGSSELDTTPTKSHTLPHQFPVPYQQRAFARLSVSHNGEHRLSLAASPVPPHLPMDASTVLHDLQSEIGALHKKHTTALEDLSLMRAAKRRAEDEVKEERSIRRKLEKSLRAAEEDLARSRRMEDAALGQVKREVEGRRKAEELLAVSRAERHTIGSPSLFAHPCANDAAMLLQLASMIRNASSGDSSPWQSGIATPAPGLVSSVTRKQPDI